MLLTRYSGPSLACHTHCFPPTAITHSLSPYPAAKDTMSHECNTLLYTRRQLRSQNRTVHCLTAHSYCARPVFYRSPHGTVVASPTLFAARLSFSCAGRSYIANTP
eukprot:scaffold107306_cov30-Tisochrysis_lutea.AAC.3